MTEMQSGKPLISEYITARFIGDEAVLMNLDNLKTYYLNETASLVWSFIERSMTFDEIVRELTESYSVSQDECIGEVNRLMESWIAEKLVHFTEKNV